MDGRRFDLDWLRIAAFGVLIFYHIGMVFVPWDFHIKAASTYDWLEPLMLLSNPWRLSLLFLISGIASQAMLTKRASAGGFASARTRRLLVPLIAGMALWVPPQVFVDVTLNHGYRGGFGAFWLRDYFRFDNSLGVVTPTWNHLWFVAYLWAYTLILAGLRTMPEAARAKVQRAFDGAMAGWRGLIVPVVFVAIVRITLADRFPETHGLIDDWCSHLLYGGAFAFGVGLGTQGPLWAVIARRWKLAMMAGFAGWIVVALANVLIKGDLDPVSLAGVRTARAIQAWGMIIGLVGMAQTHWAKDHAWRTTLSEAVFPAYIAHQTALVVVMFWLLPLGWPPLVEFLVLVAATTMGCALFYLVGRRVTWLRPLVGIGRDPRLQVRLPATV